MVLSNKSNHTYWRIHTVPNNPYPTTWKQLKFLCGQKKIPTCGHEQHKSSHSLNTWWLVQSYKIRRHLHWGISYTKFDTGHLGPRGKLLISVRSGVWVCVLKFNWHNPVSTKHSISKTDQFWICNILLCYKIMQNAGLIFHNTPGVMFELNRAVLIPCIRGLAQEMIR